MCGRFHLATPPAEVAALFGLSEVDLLPEWRPRYNIAPMQMVPVIRERETDGKRTRSMSLLKWGLVPIWADDPSIGNRMINARSETIDTKLAYRKAFEQRRCIIPADGFYEWKKTGPRTKQPMAIVGAGRKPLAMAGLWERWRPKGSGDPWLESCTVLTCAPNELLREVHDRMPVILEPETIARWLDPTAPGETVKDLLRPLASEHLMMYPVGRYVNTPANDDARCIEEFRPADEPPHEDPPSDAQGRLF